MYVTEFDVAVTDKTEDTTVDNTAESIKLVLDVEQFGMSSDLIVPTFSVQKVSFFFPLLHILIKTFHGFHRNIIKYFSA